MIQISFADGRISNKAELDEKIREILKNNQKRLGVECEYKSISGCLSELIEKSKGVSWQNVVILIGSFDIDFIEPENLLFQAGYLTINEVKQGVAEIRYRFGYPNHEVKKSLTETILNFYSFNRTSVSENRIRLEEALLNCKIDEIKLII